MLEDIRGVCLQTCLWGSRERSQANCWSFLSSCCLWTKITCILPYEAWDTSQVIIQDSAGACWGFEIPTHNNSNLTIIPGSSSSSNSLCSALSLMLSSENKLVLHADVFQCQWSSNGEAGIRTVYCKYAQLPLWFLVGGRRRASFISVSATCIKKAPIVKRNNTRKESSLFICSFLVMWYHLGWPDKLICTVVQRN